MKTIGILFISVASFLCSVPVFAQNGEASSLETNATLSDCVKYALQNNPDLHNARLNEEITNRIINTKLADWYPQINFAYNLQHNFQLPVNNFNGSITHSGSSNTSNAQLGITQNIFNRDVVLARVSANDVRKAALQDTRDQQIDLVVQVSKTFYNLILGYQQIRVIDEDIVRIGQNLQDAFFQYQAGVVDKTDYKRATIALNNAKAAKKTAVESVKATTTFLKELMGYPDSLAFSPVFDTTQMLREINADTMQAVNFDNRVEIQQLETQKKLQQYTLQYYRWSFLPNISAFGNYNLNFLNNQFSKLYSDSYPNSYLGLTLSVPIFQGGKRVQQIRQAELEVSQIDNDIASFKNNIQSQYQNALSSYKSNLADFLALKDNLALASEVYDVIQLQYRSGVKAYLDVITAETDLRTAQINYYNALYQVLSSKIDIDQALGNVQF